jgi:hypothetical protein
VNRTDVDEQRRSNRRVGLWVVGFMLFLYAASVAGVLVLN